ncbi:mucin-5AC [Anopheles gambiae]|uniref:mucin-5AC n=1 Tax=Anopheles gambiae TaxID=7165 RepID=UPI002AC9A863|nr:mucin-5AC [Anopheles gambiae]
MQVISVQFCLLSCLVFTHAHHGEEHEEPAVNRKVVENPRVSPLGSGVHHFVDVSPNLLAVKESGASPITVATSLHDDSPNNFPPNTKWPIPQAAIDVQNYLNQTANNITKPVQSSLATLTFPSLSLSDPQSGQSVVPTKPNQLSIIQQVLSNFQGSNSTIASFFQIPSSTTTEPAPQTNSSSVMNDPPPNPVAELVTASQNTFSNATNAAQQITNQLGVNIQNGLFGSLGNRPSNDEPTSGSSANGSSNPIQSLIDNTQASWNNVTGAAQNLAGQFGANVQNGISNIFGINLNRPSNDEPVVQSTEPGATTEEATSTTASSETSTGTSETTSSTETTTTESPKTTSTTARVPAIYFPLVNLVNKTQSLFNSSTLVQTVTGQLGTNVQSAFPTLFIPRPALKTESNVNELRDVNDAQLVNASAQNVPPPVPPACPTCTSGCAFKPSHGQRIVAGSNVSPHNKYPWIALLTYLDSPSGQGSLINDRTIVTTATIVESMPVIVHIRALLGVYNRTDASESITSNEISTALAHPGYKTTNQFADNIGLLVLKDPLTSFQPICLPVAIPESFPDHKATVVGWGASYPNGPLAEVLQETELQMHAPSICQTVSSQVSSNNLCGESSQLIPNAANTCTGDGGDALVLKNGTSWELIGVALDIAEFECGKSRQPAMFTNVAHYLEWIATYGPGCLCHKG